MYSIEKSLKPTAESRLTKIGVGVWVVLFIVAMARTGLQYRDRYHSANQLLTDENGKLSTQVKTLVPPFVAPPKDTSPVKIGMVVTLLAEFRAILQPHIPIAVLISYPHENAQVADDLKAILVEACGPTEGKVVCSVQSAEPNADVPGQPRQGVFVHAIDPAVIGNPASEFLIDTAFTPLNRLFVATKIDNPPIPEPLLNRYNPFNDPQFLWIEIGNGSPWKSSMRLQDGMTAEEFDKLEGWPALIKKRAHDLGVDVSALYEKHRTVLDGDTQRLANEQAHPMRPLMEGIPGKVTRAIHLNLLPGLQDTLERDTNEILSEYYKSYYERVVHILRTLQSKNVSQAAGVMNSATHPSGYLDIKAIGEQLTAILDKI